MNRRLERLNIIAKIITDRRISSQGELMDMLAKRDIRVTQATLSRDLKTLGVGKAVDSRGSLYTFSAARRGLENDIRRGFCSLEFSGNIGVMKTLSRHTDTVAAAINSMEIPSVLGIISGEGTILIILREGALATDLQRYLGNLIPCVEGGLADVPEAEL